MFIKPTPFYDAYQAKSGISTPKSSSGAHGAKKDNIADMVTLSPAAQAMMAKTAGPSDALTSLLGTAEATLTPITTGLQNVGLNKLVMLPTQQNVDRLTKQISEDMPRFLARNNLSSAPSKIDYDDKGEIKLPADYADAEKFKEALKKDPALEYALKTVHAITSHVSAMKEVAPVAEELANARTEADMAAIVKKYEVLLARQHNNTYRVSPSLYFSPKGILSNPTA